MPTQEQTLAGRTIAVPETRELEVFAAMLERRGATVLRCPLVAILDAPDPQPVLEWIRRFNTAAFDDLILLTGEGLRRLLRCMVLNAPELKDEFLAQLAITGEMNYQGGERKTFSGRYPYQQADLTFENTGLSKITAEIYTEQPWDIVLHDLYFYVIGRFSGVAIYCFPAVAATLLALEHRRRTGEGVLVEAPMIGAGINIAAEQVVEFSAYGNLLMRAGNRGPTAAPQGLYLAAELDDTAGADREVRGVVCQCVARLADNLKPEYAEALRRMTVLYRDHMHGNEPVHTWPVGD